MSGSHQIRFLTIGALFSLVGVLVLFQMVSIQNRPDMWDLKKRNETLHNTIDLTVNPERGWIYDANGKLLAGSKEAYEVGIDFKSQGEKTGAAETAAIVSAVSKVTGFEYAKLLAMTQIDREKVVYVRLANGLDTTQANELKRLKKESADQGSNELRSMFMRVYLQRSYPEGSLASNVLGFVTFLDPRTPRGVNGVEGRYNSYLAGTAVEVSLPASPYDIASIPNLPTGASLILTLNREIQGSVEKIIDKAVKDNGAVSGTAIVMDPRNGEILAMASTPRINPNEYWVNNAELTSWNRAVSQIYEPGSIFKPITMALAVDAGKVTPKTTYNDTGVFVASGRRINNWDGRAYGVQTMVGCLEHSLNTCLSWVVNQLGPDKFYQGLKSFGIGQLSNVDLDGEDYYPVRQPQDENWNLLSLATNSFGQGLAVAPIQIVSAISAIPNGGKIMAPHVLRAVVDNGRQYNTPPQVVSQPISKEAADTVNEMLAQAIDGESLHLKIDGYRFAGKTGTAEIPMPTGGYSSNKTNASFIGWGPVDDPRFLIYVWLQEPGGPQPFGSVVAAPVFKDIFLSCVQLTNLPPDAIRKQLTDKKP